MASANSPTRADPPRAYLRWLAGVIVAAIALVYANSVTAPFLFDDAGAVVDNPTIRRLASFDVLLPPGDGSTTTGRPLVNLSFALNYALSGEAVWSYHVSNLAIHAATALLLFGLARRTLLRPTDGGARLAPNATMIGFYVALLWALHPLQTESVDCIAQRTEILCGLLYVLTLYGFVRATGAGDTGVVVARRVWAGISVLACLAGMAAKEVMVTAPLMVFLFDRTFVAGTFSAAWRARRFYYLGLALTWLLLLLLVLPRGGSRGVAAGFGLGVSGWSYALKQCDALVHYLRLAVWPHPLVLDYGTAVVHSAAAVWWQGLVVLSLLAGTTWMLVRRPMLGFLGAWGFVILAPSSSFLPLVTQTMAEHRMYLALASLIGAFVWLAYRYVPAAPRLGLPAIAVVMGLVTHARNHDYRDAYTIWSATVADYPPSARAHHNLALVLVQRGDPVQAQAQFGQAIALDPSYATAYYNWGVVLLGEGRLAEAADRFESALRLEPFHGDALVNLGNVLVRLQRPADAIKRYEAALRLRPGADVHYNFGVALVDAGRAEAATEQFQAALRLNPRLAEAQYQLGRLSERDHRTGEAEQRYLATLKISPEHAAAHARLGLLCAKDHRLDEGARHLREAVRLLPNDADVRANLGNVLLLQGQARDALVQYEAALRLRPGDARLRESIQNARESLRE